MASVMLRVGLVLSALVGRTYTWIPDVDCLTIDGTEGRCMAPSKCPSTFNGVRPHYCRYSKGYSTRVCCPHSSGNSFSNIAKEFPDNYYSGNEPISFPSESSSQNRPSNSRPQSSNNSPLIFNGDSGFEPYDPRPSNNRPRPSSEPNYGNEYNPSQGYRPSTGTGDYNNPSQGNRPSSGGNNYNNPSQGNRPGYGNEYNPSQNNRPSGSGNNYNNPSQGSRPSGGNNYNNPSQGNRPGYGNEYNPSQNNRPSGSGNNYNNPLQGNRPSGGNNYNNPSQGNRPSSGNNHNNPSYENQGNRPQPGAWEIPSGGSQSQHVKRTTARPTWEVDSSRVTPSSNSNKRVSEIKCEEYSVSVSESIGVLPLSIDAEAVPLKVQKCDFSAVKLIVGGEAADLGEFPHMAAIGFQSRGSQNVLWNCGGTLISDRYVMTAAHCINTTYGNPVMVRLGEYNLMSDYDGAEPADYRVEKLIVHPNYAKSYKYNDIALIRLDRRVDFNKGVRPACLFTENIVKSKPTATGWGRTDFVGKQSDILMKVNLNVIDNRQCNSYYSTNNPGSQSFNKGIVDTMLCAGEVQGGRDTCLGDSGGPLTVTKKENPCIHFVIGITSFGKICGAPQSPGVYTKVSKYLSWIERTVWQQ